MESCESAWKHATRATMQTQMNSPIDAVETAVCPTAVMGSKIGRRHATMDRTTLEAFLIDVDWTAHFLDVAMESSIRMKPVTMETQTIATTVCKVVRSPGAGTVSSGVTGSRASLALNIAMTEMPTTAMTATNTAVEESLPLQINSNPRVHSKITGSLGAGGRSHK